MCYSGKVICQGHTCLCHVQAYIKDTHDHVCDIISYGHTKHALGM